MLRRFLAAFIVISFLPAVSGAAPLCRIYDADEVLKSHVRSDGGGLAFVDPTGRPWMLVASPDDPAILNRGSGQFHPAPLAEVERALDSITWSGTGLLSAEVFLLPYPRRELLPSSADDGSIYLSPGVYPYTVESSHALVAHEYGHLVHQRLLPDDDVAGWNRYRELRGLTDESVYNERAEHRNRPHEIFAEDFRALFGGSLANYSGSIENAGLSLPNLVPGLRQFFVDLADRGAAPTAPAALAAAPNPFVASTRLTLPALGVSARLEIVDASGRRVRRLDAADSSDLAWDGRDDAGQPLPAGIYFARLTGAAATRSLKLVKVR